MRWKVADWPMMIKLRLGPLLALIMMAVISWIGTSSLDNKVSQLTNVVENNLKGGAELSELRTELSSVNGELYRITTLQAAEAEELDLTSAMESMLEIDFASAVSLMTPFKDNYIKASNNLTAVVAQGVAASETRAVAAHEEASTATAALLTFTIVAIIIVVGISVVVSLNTIRSTKAIALTTQKLAEGDKNIDTNSLHRRECQHPWPQP